MVYTLKASETNVAVGLGSWTHTTTQNGMYFASMSCSEVPPSSIILTIAQSGSASLSVSTSAPATSQGYIDLQQLFNCQAGDVITFTLSSAAEIDNELNTVKTIMKINPGTC